ncbi:MAG: septum formation protein Maf, partial [Pseudomonadota bacterium]
MAFILGSGSPRRLDLLAQLFIKPDAVRRRVLDETPRKGEIPLVYCRSTS